jgi:hypothetical protein
VAKKKVDDVIANFFGDDDMDWLDGDSEEIPKSARASLDEAPVPLADAPAPPDVSLDALDVEETMESAVAAPAPDATEVTQPTVRVSEDTAEVTQPISAEEPAPGPDTSVSLAGDPGVFDELQPAPLTPDALVSISDVDPPTLEVDPTSEEVPIQEDMELLSEGAAPVEEPAPVDDPGEYPPPAEDPSPAPEVTETLADETEVVPKPAPIEKWEPRSDHEQWRELAVGLVSEAARVSEGRGDLLFQAAQIYRRRLGDVEGARVLLEDALTAGLHTPELHEARAAVGRDLSDDALARDAAIKRAELIDGPVAAAAWERVAALATDNPGLAIEALEKAVEADPSSVTALGALAGHLRGDAEHADQLQFVLGRLAELAGPPISALYQHERALLLEELGRDVEAIAAQVLPRRGSRGIAAGGSGARGLAHGGGATRGRGRCAPVPGEERERRVASLCAVPTGGRARECGRARLGPRCLP